MDNQLSKHCTWILRSLCSIVRLVTTCPHGVVCMKLNLEKLMSLVDEKLINPAVTYRILAKQKATKIVDVGNLPFKLSLKVCACVIFIAGDL